MTMPVYRNRLYRLFCPIYLRGEVYPPVRIEVEGNGSTADMKMTVTEENGQETFRLDFVITHKQPDGKSKTYVSHLKAVAANESDDYVPVSALMVNNVEVDLNRPEGVYLALNRLTDILRPVYHPGFYRRYDGDNPQNLPLFPRILDEKKLKRELHRQDTLSHKMKNRILSRFSRW